MNNSKELKFFFPGIPFSKQSVRISPVYTRGGIPVTFINKKTGKPQVMISKHQSKKIIDGEKSLKGQILDQLPQGMTPFTGAVVIKRLIYVFPPLKSMKKAQKVALNEGKLLPKITKPDLIDNLNKGLFDALEGLVFMNDAQVCSMAFVSKVFGNKPGIYLDLIGDYR